MLAVARLSLIFGLCSFLEYDSVHSFAPSLPVATSRRCHQNKYMIRLHVHAQSRTDSDQQQQSSPFNIETIDIPSFSAESPSVLHKVYVTSILSESQSQQCLQIARNYAQITKRWDQPDFERHATFATCDFAVEDCPELSEYLDEVSFHDKVLTFLAHNYNIPLEELSYLDLFCANYRARDGNDDDENDVMDSLEAHRDGSLLSFTVTLTDPSKFENGGTFFDALRDVAPNDRSLQPGGVIRPTRAGCAVMHSGKALHGANKITAGERTVLVGFVDVAEWRQRLGALTDACRVWGRMDVAKMRYERRHLQKYNLKWQPKPRKVGERYGVSHITSKNVPAFASVKRRADPEWQRIQRLQAEDALLRSVLLSDDEVEEFEPMELSEGDVSFL